jgi:hypothetical protein
VNVRLMTRLMKVDEVVQRRIDEDEGVDYGEDERKEEERDGKRAERSSF